MGKNAFGRMRQTDLAQFERWSGAEKEGLGLQVAENSAEAELEAPLSSLEELHSFLHYSMLAPPTCSCIPVLPPATF